MQEGSFLSKQFCRTYDNHDQKEPFKTFCLIPFLINLTHEKPFAEATPYSIIRMKIQLQLYRGEYLNIL